MFASFVWAFFKLSAHLITISQPCHSACAAIFQFVSTLEKKKYIKYLNPTGGVAFRGSAFSAEHLEPVVQMVRTGWLLPMLEIFWLLPSGGQSSHGNRAKFIQGFLVMCPYDLSSSISDTCSVKTASLLTVLYFMRASASLHPSSSPPWKSVMLSQKPPFCVLITGVTREMSA